MQHIVVDALAHRPVATSLQLVWLRIEEAQRTSTSPRCGLVTQYSPATSSLAPP